MEWGSPYQQPPGGYLTPGMTPANIGMQQSSVDQYNAQQTAIDQYNLAARAANFAQYNQQNLPPQFQQDPSTAQFAGGFSHQPSNPSLSHGQQSSYSASWPIEDMSTVGPGRSYSSTGLHETRSSGEGSTQNRSYSHSRRQKRDVETIAKEEGDKALKHPQGYGWPRDRETRYVKKTISEKTENQARSQCPICKKMVELDNWVRHATTHATPLDDVARPAQKDIDYWFIGDLLKNATKDSSLITSYSCQLCNVDHLNFEEMLRHIQDVEHMHAVYRWISQPSTIGNDRYKNILPDIPIKSRHLKFYFCEVCHKLLGWAKSNLAQHLGDKQHSQKVQKMRENLQWVIKGHKMRNEGSLSMDLADEHPVPEPDMFQRDPDAMNVPNRIAPANKLSEDDDLRSLPPPEQKEKRVSAYGDGSNLKRHIYNPASESSRDQSRNEKYHRGIALTSNTEFSSSTSYGTMEVREMEYGRRKRDPQLGVTKPKTDQRKVSRDAPHGMDRQEIYVARYDDPQSHADEPKVVKDSLPTDETKQSSGRNIPKVLNRGKLQEIVHSIRSTSTGEVQKHKDASKSKAAVLAILKGDGDPLQASESRDISASDTFMSGNIHSSDANISRDLKSTRSPVRMSYSSHESRRHSSHFSAQPVSIPHVGRAIEQGGYSPTERTYVSNSDADYPSGLGNFENQHRNTLEKREYSYERESTHSLQSASRDQLSQSIAGRNLTPKKRGSHYEMENSLAERIHSPVLLKGSSGRHDFSLHDRKESSEQHRQPVEPYRPTERRYRTPSRQGSPGRDILVKLRGNEISVEEKGLLGADGTTDRHRTSDRRRSWDRQRTPDRRRSPIRRRTPDRRSIDRRRTPDRRSIDRHRTPDKRSTDRRRTPDRRSIDRRRTPEKPRSPRRRRSPIRHRSSERHSRHSGAHKRSPENRSHLKTSQSSFRTSSLEGRSHTSKREANDERGHASFAVKKTKRRLSPVVLDVNARAALTKRIETTWQIYYHKYYSCVLTNPEIVLEMQKEYLRSYKGCFKNDPYFELYYTKVAKPEDLREALILRIDRGSPGPDPDSVQDHVATSSLVSSVPNVNWIEQHHKQTLPPPQHSLAGHFNSSLKPYGQSNSTARRPVVDIVDLTGNTTRSTGHKSAASSNVIQAKKIPDHSKQEPPFSRDRKPTDSLTKSQLPPPTKARSNLGQNTKASVPSRPTENYDRAKDNLDIDKNVPLQSGGSSSNNTPDLFSSVKTRGIFPEDSVTSSRVNNKSYPPSREDRFKEREGEFQGRENRFKECKKAPTDQPKTEDPKKLEKIEREDRFQEARSFKGISQNDPIITSTTQNFEKKILQADKDGSRPRSVLGRLGPQRKSNSSSGTANHLSSQDSHSRRTDRSPRDTLPPSNRTKEVTPSDWAPAHSSKPNKSSEASLTEMFSDPFLGFVHKTLTGIILVGQYQESMAGSRETDQLREEINAEQEQMQARMVTPDGHLLIQLARCCIENPDNIEKAFPDVNPDIGVILRNLDKNVVSLIADTPIIVDQQPKHPY